MWQGAHRPAERLLHRIALGSPGAIAAAEMADDALAGRAASGPGQRPVFIAGLARSGTTLLLELLNGTGAFTSLTYRHMPFVTAPVLWRRFGASLARNRARAERAHGDGLAVGLDSPEAFEEVFWRGRLGDGHIEARRLASERVPSREDIEAFRRFVGRVVAATAPERRYLSKNNTNLLRLAALRRAFPDAVILVPFRDPESFVRSVLDQHARFMAIHREDRFARRYMGWLGHFEFGADFRPLGLEKVPPFDGPPEALGRDYLFAYWCAVHRWLLAARPADCLLFDYRGLCAEPEQTLRTLSDAVGVAPGAFGAQDVRRLARPSPPRDATGVEAEAWRLYADLRVACPA